jgi:YD repeat-containing protein
MPVRNSLLPSHDPSLRTDNDVDAAIPGWTDSTPGGVGVTDPGEPPEAHIAVLDESRWLNDTGGFVGLHNGSVSYRAVDLVIPGRGIDFVLARRYNSKLSDTPDPITGAGPGPMGWGWDHSYRIFIRQEYSIGGPVELFNGNNRVDVYGGTEPYPCPGGIYNRLYYDTANALMMVRGRNGSKTAFKVAVDTVQTRFYRIEWQEDANGNRLTFVYADPPLLPQSMKLTRVIDTFGRPIDFGYDANGRLQSVTDFAGRIVFYEYDPSTQELLSARSPLVTSTGGFNDFPAGRKEKYTYTSGGGPLNHNLENIIRPNEVALASNVPFVHFEYAIDDWVSSQTLGNNNGVGDAGGVIGYQYVALNISAQLDNPLLPRVRTEVTDRKGNLTHFEFNENGNMLSVKEFTSPTSHVDTALVYNGPDGEVTHITHPRGNSEERWYVVPSPHTVASRYLMGYLSQIQYSSGSIPSDHPQRGLSYSWEPVFGHLRARTDERGFTTEYKYEYMEGSSSLLSLIAAELGVTTTEAGWITAGLLVGQDLNGNGQPAIVRGNLVQRVEPTVTLSNLGGVQPQWNQEGGSTQEAIHSFTYNDFGQLNSETDAEENVSYYLYFPDIDPCGLTPPDPPGGGQGQSQEGGIDPEPYWYTPGGYLRHISHDVPFPLLDPQLGDIHARALASDIGRDSATNPPFVEKAWDFQRDQYGHVSAAVDPRGVWTIYSVSELDETWKVARATDTSWASIRNGGCNPTGSEDLSGQAYAYHTKFQFDANGNVVAELVQNSGNLADQGLVLDSSKRTSRTTS